MLLSVWQRWNTTYINLLATWLSEPDMIGTSTHTIVAIKRKVILSNPNKINLMVNLFSNAK